MVKPGMTVANLKTYNLILTTHEMYGENITYYSKNPPNNFKLDDFTVSHFEDNRSCGDDITVYMKIGDDNTFIDWSFEGNTSIVTTACASIFGESIIGLPIKDIFEMDLAYIIELIEQDISKRRHRGAVFGLLATRNAIHEYLGDGEVDDFSDVIK